MSKEKSSCKVKEVYKIEKLRTNLKNSIAKLMFFKTEFQFAEKTKIRIVDKM